MSVKLVIMVVYALSWHAGCEDTGFTYNGFRSADLSLDGLAEVTSNGLLKLTNSTTRKKGHAFHPNPIRFKNSPDGSAISFSTTFVFAIAPEYPTFGGHGLAFAIAPKRGLPGGVASQYLGLLSATNNGNLTNHLFAVEFDTISNQEFDDIDDNHVGININRMKSEISMPAGYYVGNKPFSQNLTLISGQPMQAWVEYSGSKKQINVSLAPLHVAKPKIPLLSLSYDLTPILEQTMYLGFSSATGYGFSIHYVLGWSFKIHGMADEGLDISLLPRLPRLVPKKKSKLLTIGLPVILTVSVLAMVSCVTYYIMVKRKFAEVLEDWEAEYVPQRFKYKDLYTATNGFREEKLLGTGGFGRVYRGVLPNKKTEIAVKKVSHESRQGMKAFMAEVISMGQLCHRNLVPLLGYCRRKGELLLVYEYMSKGSLDKYLYDDKPECCLNWSQRFQVIKGVASALFYLHEEWEQVVVHRDIKASNVLLDSEWNARLGDFGLARLYDHGTDPKTTHLVGTLGYLAPELIKTSKATTSTDVFAFGAFLLEVACGRRPIEPKALNEDLVLVEWVFSWWSRGEILQVIDPRLGPNYVAEEVELVLKLGLLCSLLEPKSRPSMRQIVMYLEGSMAPPELSSLSLSTAGLSGGENGGFDDFVVPLSSFGENTSSNWSSITNSIS
ncbi:PREDICTED: L-type lectin-domain containing receptor kinase IV.1-like [Ipomoea nil]|uniref:L-type lectin-domain containing receptor kinase IV.1-like n=1 Tax=Ipomoea nil TaxID=35883 RepID=UPI000901CCC1|nr:PREDICTED: L-type lectin-domain containing receptor kinase IV.1-like [Ipomoea nil]